MEAYMMGLTERQAEVLAYLRSYMKVTGGEEAPSFDEIMLACDFRSKSDIHRVMIALEARGHIRRMFGRARAIELVDRSCPHCGKRI
jgi:repressor LexA